MWKRKETRNTIIVGLGVFLSLVAAGLVNILTGQLHLSVIVTLVFLAFTMVGWIGVGVYDRRHTEVNQKLSALPQQQEAKNRQRLLERVRYRWINGVLDQSLYHEARIELGLSKHPDALADPWHLSIRQQEQNQQLLPASTRIIEVYDKANGELLILGEPGSGKTTLLLELTQTLLRRAARDKIHPLPVVFSLSSWSVKHASLAEWLVEELYLKYQVPRSVGYTWVSDSQILPLLDGLDEVNESDRTVCAEAINMYRRDHGTVPTVVCSRTSEYFAQEVKLQLQYAVVIHPLAPNQVDTYLEQVGEQMEVVRTALHKDTVLLDLISTPLLLSVIILAFQSEATIDNLLKGSLEERRKLLFETFIHRMLEIHRLDAPYTQQKTVKWLHWLAKQLLQHNLTEFYFEELWADWLQKSYLYLLISTILSGIVIGFSLALAFMLMFGFGFRFVFSNPLEFYIFVSMICLIYGIFVMAVFHWRQKKIGYTEIVNWSWENLRRKKYYFLLLTSCGELVVAPAIGVFAAFHFGTLFGLFFGLIAGIGWAIASGLDAGFSSNMLDKYDRLRPNQGFRTSALYGLMIGLIFGCGGGLFFGLLWGLIFGPSIGVLVGLTVCLFLTIWVGGLNYGGVACFQQGLLRLMLWQTGVIPLRYVRFLDYLTKCTLLHRVGGGYIFVHRLLLDYLASEEQWNGEKI